MVRWWSVSREATAACMCVGVCARALTRSLGARRRLERNSSDKMPLAHEAPKVPPHVCVCGAWGEKMSCRSRAVRLTAGACGCSGCVCAYACGLLTE